MKPFCPLPLSHPVFSSSLSGFFLSIFFQPGLLPAMCSFFPLSLNHCTFPLCFIPPLRNHLLYSFPSTCTTSTSSYFYFAHVYIFICFSFMVFPANRILSFFTLLIQFCRYRSSPLSFLLLFCLWCVQILGSQVCLQPLDTRRAIY